MCQRYRVGGNIPHKDLRRYLSWTLLFTLMLSCTACTHRQEEPATQNALSQHTGATGSTILKHAPLFYPNTAATSSLHQEIQPAVPRLAADRRREHGSTKRVALAGC